MNELSFYQIVLFFMIYSFVGWSCEVIYCSIGNKKFINRGFLYGPICPIYGCGAIIVILVLQPLKNNLILLFFATMILTSALEYFVSWLLEKAFDTKWWDYSHYQFNLHGRICLLNSVLFGVMGILAVKYVNPIVFSFISIFNVFWTKVLAISFLTLFSIDLIFTLKSMIDFRVYLKKFETFIHYLKKKVEQEKWVINFQDNVEEFVKKVKENISNHIYLQKEEKAEIDKNISKFVDKRKSYKRFINKFPNLNSKKFPKSVEQIKHLLKK